MITTPTVSGGPGQAPYRDRYVDDLNEVWSTHSIETAKRLSTAMFPLVLADDHLLARVQSAEHDESRPTARRRVLAEQADETARTLRVLRA